MAEYIDKLNILDTGLCQGIDCDDCLFSSDTDDKCLLRTRVMAMEPADVIERTKEMQEFYKGEHEKLEKIEKIIKDYDTNCGLEEYMYLDQIKYVLEQE